MAARQKPELDLSNEVTRTAIPQSAARRASLSQPTGVLDGLQGRRIRCVLDPATGAWNLESTVALLREALERVAEEKGDLAVALLSVHTIDDTGADASPASDEIMRSVARRLRPVIGTTNKLGRAGQHQLLVIFEVFGPEDVAHTAWQLRERSRIPTTDDEAPLAVAVGYSHCVSGGRYDATALIKQSQAALALAEEQERLRSTTSTTSTTSTSSTDDDSTTRYRIARLFPPRT